MQWKIICSVEKCVKYYKSELIMKRMVQTTHFGKKAEGKAVE